MAEDLIITNQPLERRVRASGKVRYVVVVKSEPIVWDLDARRLGQAPALAIVQSLRNSIERINQIASAGTLRAREAAARAFADGKRWAEKRYSGGRIGPMPPNQSPRAFNDSGRFAASLTANASADAWRINVAANRLDETTGNVQRIYARLVSMVPAFGSPALLFDDPGVIDAIRTGLDGAISAGVMSEEAMSLQRARLIARRNQALLSLIRRFGG